jgi:hypothetical protein
MKSGAGILAVTPGHHRSRGRGTDATLSLKFPTQVSSLFLP